MDQKPEKNQYNAERNSYVIGFLLSIFLTALSFGLVWLKLLPMANGLAVISILAAVQIFVQLRCFLHIDLHKSHRDDLYLILLTILIMTIIIAGTIWTLWNQHLRMMV